MKTKLLKSKSFKKGETSGSSQHRYAASVEKGDNVWKREWSGFISGVKILNGETGGSISLPKKFDLASSEDNSSSRGSTFSYLFGSSPVKKQQNKTKKSSLAHSSVTNRLVGSQNSDEGTVETSSSSKHQRAITEAQKYGIATKEMSRKQIRQFLHLTKSPIKQKAELLLENFKPHLLMESFLQWYQQGPYPIDVIAEKLIIRRALKEAKQLGLKYNYLGIHPSWIARRRERRREIKGDWQGTHFKYNDTGDIIFRNDKLPHSAFALESKTPDEILEANMTTKYIPEVLLK